MVKKFHGNSAKNARIKIDYRGKKPKVSFSYPAKHYQQEGSMFPFIIIIWVLIMSPAIIGYSLGSGIKEESEVKDYFNSTHDCYPYPAGEDNWFRIENILKANKASFDFVVLIKLLCLVVPPFLIYFPFRKFWKNVYPKFQAWGTSKKLARFNPKDVRYNNEFGYYCEIPVFKNIVLNYKARGDFARYLDWIEIREHHFVYLRLKKNKKNRKKPKKRINEWLWYARFYFSKKIEKGKLEVLFK